MEPRKICGRGFFGSRLRWEGGLFDGFVGSFFLAGLRLMACLPRAIVRSI